MSTQQRLQAFFDYLRRFLVNLNLFQTRLANAQEIRRQILTTRLFLILFAVLIIILVTYTSLSVQTKIIIVQQPSLATFEKLQQRYSNTLKCPCKRISIPYGSFLRIVPSFHQVCTSTFVSQSWLDFVFDIDLSMIDHLDVRKTHSGMWQMIAALCQSASDFVADSLKDLLKMSSINSIAASESEFVTRSQTALAEMHRRTIDSFNTSLFILEGYMEADSYMTGLLTNYAMLGIVSQFRRMLILDVLAISYLTPTSDIWCHCYQDRSCPMPANLYTANITAAYINYDYRRITPNATLPGLIVDCSPLLITFGSYLECFYNQSCLDLLLHTKKNPKNNIPLPFYFLLING